MAYTQADLDLLGKLTARGFEPLYGRVSAWRVYNAFGYGLFTGGSHLRRPPVMLENIWIYR